jgi:ABC-type sugar transport system substrate-binding protein
VFKALANKAGWQVLDVVGQGTAPEQISAVENFITQKVDALVVVQNSPETTSECLKKASAAGIPKFNLTHPPPTSPGSRASPDSTGCTTGSSQRSRQ